MAETPDRIRDDIEATRSNLTRNVNRLADRISPKRVASRNWNALRGKVGTLYRKVTGQRSPAIVAAGGEGRTLPHRRGSTA